MKIILFNWNTQLYEYGNLNNKKVEDGKLKYSQIKDDIKEYFNNSNEDVIPIAILQEIPYKIKEQNKWGSHEIYNTFINDFKEDEYDIIYLKDEGEKKCWHIKMTVVIAPKNTIRACKNKSNLFVPFKITKDDINVYILGLHSHNAYEVREWLENNQDFNPDIMVGDFNAGNYKKRENDNKIVENRQNYLLLTEGYLDACQGQCTTRYNTQIDHILIKNYTDPPKYEHEKVKIDSKNQNSDHYPILCEITLLSQ